MEQFSRSKRRERRRKSSTSPPAFPRLRFSTTVGRLAGSFHPWGGVFPQTVSPLKQIGQEMAVEIDFPNDSGNSERGTPVAKDDGLIMHDLKFAFRQLLKK